MVHGHDLRGSTRGAAGDGLRRLTPEPVGWTSVASLAQDPAAINGLLDRLKAHHRTDDDAIAASFLLSGCARMLAGIAIEAYLTQGRVPDVSAENVLLLFAQSGHPAQAALAATRGTAGPDRAALRPLLRQGIVDGLTGIVEALRATGRRGPYAQWAIVADTCVAIFEEVGRRYGRMDDAVAEAEAFLDTTPPLIGGANYEQLNVDGRSGWFRVRNTCCLIYRCSTMGYCSTCPLLPADERDKRRRAALLG